MFTLLKEVNRQIKENGSIAKILLDECVDYIYKHEGTLRAKIISCKLGKCF